MKLDINTSEEAFEEVKVPGFVSPTVVNSPPLNELNDDINEHRNEISDFDNIRTLSDTIFEDC